MPKIDSTPTADLSKESVKPEWFDVECMIYECLEKPDIESWEKLKKEVTTLLEGRKNVCEND